MLSSSANLNKHDQGHLEGEIKRMSFLLLFLFSVSILTTKRY